MINRHLLSVVQSLLDRHAAVGLLGPRQVGKTTLAHQIAESKPSIYLDLESPSDQNKLQNPELYLAQHTDSLVILDEIHRAPDLFQVLRGIIDAGRHQGKRVGRFLILGSASIDLLKQSSESLAGRISYIELGGITVDEIKETHETMNQLWLRGGFPESLLAINEQASVEWREDFIRTYLERDIPQLGSKIPADTLRRFWTMLAHNQGTIMNAARIAAGLGLSGQSVCRYLDLLVDLLLVRKLPPYIENIGKRMIKSPKVFVRDSGLTHRLLGIDDSETLLGHPVIGASWEGFVIENLLLNAPRYTEAFFYRTAAGAEIDLILKLPKNKIWAIEIKRSLTPKIERGFYHARDDIKPDENFLVYPGDERYPMNTDTDVISLTSLIRLLKQEFK